MSLLIVSRSANNLRPPTQTVPVTWDSRTGITVHHTGADFSSWRAVQEWSMGTKGFWDIDYNHGISGGRVHDLRGWLVRGAHDGINTNLGVCLGGYFEHELPPAEDLDALVAYIREARRLSGRTLAAEGHRDVSTTSCPGDALYEWLQDELPARLAGQVGTPPAKPTPKPARRPAPGPVVPFPLPARWYFGPASGPASSVSGVYRRRFGSRTDREWLQEWTRQLVRRGWSAGKGRRYLTRHGADGVYGAEYAKLILAFQHDQRLRGDALLGRFTWDAAYRNPVTQ